MRTSEPFVIKSVDEEGWDKMLNIKAVTQI